MRFYGFQKMTLLDFPGKVACTLFTGGCNMRCPFCHNALLVTELEQGNDTWDEAEVLTFLRRRKGLLDGVCVTGGEPTLQPELAPFLRRVKELGYAVKLDTNGTRPEVLRALVGEGLVDYVAMDVKNSPARYALTAGVPAAELSGVNTILLDNIDLSAIMKNEDTVLRQIIIPNNATNVSGEQEAKITLRIKNKEISTIRSSNITFTGVTEGLEAKSIAQQLQVTYRASSEDVKKISANNVRIVADMTEFTQPGTYQVPVEVYFDGFSGAGVIGDYTVAVTLSRIEE